MTSKTKHIIVNVYIVLILGTLISVLVSGNRGYF